MSAAVRRGTDGDGAGRGGAVGGREARVGLGMGRGEKAHGGEGVGRWDGLGWTRRKKRRSECLLREDSGRECARRGRERLIRARRQGKVAVSLCSLTGGVSASESALRVIARWWRVRAPAHARHQGQGPKSHTVTPPASARLPLSASSSSLAPSTSAAAGAMADGRGRGLYLYTAVEEETTPLVSSHPPRSPRSRS